MSLSKLEYNKDWSELLYFDPSSESGLRWKNTKLGNFKQVLIVADSVAGVKYYRRNKAPNCWIITIDKIRYLAHRIIWVIKNGNIDPNLVVDHLDGNPFNNKLNNLKLKSSSGNSRNTKKTTRNTSGVVGVSYSKTRNAWLATYIDLKGNNRSKNFSCMKYGDSAFDLAVKFRQNAEKILKEDGQGYSDRHGK
jgi:hypothetical protein